MENKMMETMIGNFLNRMAISLVVCIVVMSIITIMKPLAQPVESQCGTNSSPVILEGMINVRCR